MTLYCVVPRELSDRLHERLRRHFRDDPLVRVVVERREDERRQAPERRAAGLTPLEEQRRIRSTEGRRVAERRATRVVVDPPPLPRMTSEVADRLVFFEQIEPTAQQLEDRDTARLVMRIQAGDTDAFGDLYLRYFDRVYSYVRVLLRNAHDAEEAAQQVFLQVLEALPTYERRRQPFRAWLFVVLRNHAMALLRRRGRTDLYDPTDLDVLRDETATEAVDPSPVLDWISDSELMMFVERLPLIQRQVLVLRFLLGLSTEETAAVVGCTGTSARTLQHRALRYLEQRLTSVGRAPEHVERGRSRAAMRFAPVLRSRRFVLLG